MSNCLILQLLGVLRSVDVAKSICKLLKLVDENIV